MSKDGNRIVNRVSTCVFERTCGCGFVCLRPCVPLRSRHGNRHEFIYIYILDINKHIRDSRLEAEALVRKIALAEHNYGFEFAR